LGWICPRWGGFAGVGHRWVGFACVGLAHVGPARVDPPSLGGIRSRWSSLGFVTIGWNRWRWSSLGWIHPLWSSSHPGLQLLRRLASPSFTTLTRVVSALVVVGVFPSSSWMDHENGPRQASWLVFRNSQPGPPPSWVTRVFLPPRIFR